jgi:glycosyltransferase involved in cell wall biosynthesis
MHQQTLISIIVPTYKVTPLIEACITSIQQQSHPAFEVIIVNYDENKDEYLEQLTSRLNDSRIRLHQFDVKGIYTAMNEGIRISKGEWIIFLGFDDKLDNPHVFESFFKHKIDTSIDLLLGNVRIINQSSKLIPKVYKNKFSKAMYWKNTMHHQGVFYRAGIFNETKFDEQYHILGDYQLHLRLLNLKLQYTYQDTFIAICDGQGISKKFNTQLYGEEIRLKKETLSSFLFVLNCCWIPLKMIVKQFSSAA